MKRDFLVRLLEADEMLERGQGEEADQVLDDLETRILETREYPYCGVPVINAVLAEKERECKEDRIRLDANLQIGGDIGVESMYLCSVFANLLDNAIHACRDLPAETERVITLRAALRGAYLVIRSENPCVGKRQGKAREGHGYGTRILQEIAGRFRGEYRAEQKAGVYCAFISLLTETQSV